MNKGLPVSELTDAELEAQGTQAHTTRNYVFLHGTAAQFANHTTRMLSLEQEYLRRHPKRTWQRSGGAASVPMEAAEQLHRELAGVILQLMALAERPYEERADAQLPRVNDPIRCLLEKVAERDGRMHKLELHQAARECGMRREVLATLYNGNHQLLAVDRSDRVLTVAGRDYLAGKSR
jgi:Family of unknown function (DUF6158)